MDKDAVTPNPENPPRVEQMPHEQKESLHLPISNVQDCALYMLDLNGRVSTWNIGAQRIKGYRAKDIIGQHVSAFYPEEDIVAGLPARELEAVIAQGHFETEGWRVRQDGSRFWAHMVLTPITDDDGSVRGFATVTNDISKRRAREDVRFRKVIDSAPSAMVMINAIGQIEMVNRQTERLFQYSRAELLGQPVEILVPLRARQHHPELRAGYVINPESRPMGAGRDLYARRKDVRSISTYR